MDGKLTEKDALNIAWNYFQQHAQQRISYFNYFIMFSSIMITALIATLSPQFNLNFLGVGIGLMQVMIAVVFVKIDQRNKYLTKIGEKALIEIENSYNLPECINSSSAKVFNNEYITTKEIKKTRNWYKVILWQISHSSSYKMIYYSFAFAGLVGVILSIYGINYQKHKTPQNTNIKVFIDYSSARRAIPISDIKPFVIQNTNWGPR